MCAPSTPYISIEPVWDMAANIPINATIVIFADYGTHLLILLLMQDFNQTVIKT